jgi:hypothetical protein
MSLRQFIPAVIVGLLLPLCCCGSRSVGCSTLLRYLLDSGEIIRHPSLILLDYFRFCRFYPTETRIPAPDLLTLKGKSPDSEAGARTGFVCHGGSPVTTRTVMDARSLHNSAISEIRLL